MTEARRKVRLEELGITHVRPKIAATGTIILEVPGENSAARIDSLAEKLPTALTDKEVRIARPVKCADLRVTGLDDSVGKEDLAVVIAKVRECSPAEVKVGNIKRDPSGLGAAWTQCLASAAKKTAAAGRVIVGWVSARMEALAPRPLQCFKCLEVGQVHRFG